MEFVNKKITIDYQCETNEVTGIWSEKMICNILNIPFNTTREYLNLYCPIDIQNDIEDILSTQLNELCINEHYGNDNTYYDFKTVNNETVSLKTNIKNFKICPQNIGQVSLKSFNKKTDYNLKTSNDYKKLVYSNTIELLNLYLNNLFCCKYNIFIRYDESKIYLIETDKKLEFFIDPEDIIFSQTIETWKESMTLSIKTDDGKKLSLCNFQVHNNRDCLKCRFHLDSLLKLSGICVQFKTFNLKNNYNIKVKEKIDTDSDMVNTEKTKVFQTFSYIGSKTKLLDWIGINIENYIHKELNQIDSFLDPFSGTGVVSYHLLENGCKYVISNDIQHYAYTVSSIWSDIDINIPKMRLEIKLINKFLSVVNDDFISTDIDYILLNYTERSEIPRMFFTEINGFRIDKARQHIEKLKTDNTVTYNEYKLLLKSLLYAVTDISNTASTYGAFLKEYKDKAQKCLELNVNLLDTLVESNNDIIHKSYNLDIKDLISMIEPVEVCYLDSPYNNRNYSKNYFVLEGISLYDYCETRLKTGLRNIDIPGASTYCSTVTTFNSFKHLFNNIKSKYLIMSYSSDGILEKESILSLLSHNWTNIICHEKLHKKFKSNVNTVKEDIIEYLFCATAITSDTE